VATLEGAVLADGGTLADLAPTSLFLLGIVPSRGMTGRSLTAMV
jgi:hypothetical protein